MYMSLNDMLALGRAMLTSALLPRSITRRWLKPCEHTASPDTAVGAPWEIERQRALTPDGRAIDVYTKGGTLFSYAALLAVAPDPGLVVGALVTATPPARKDVAGLANLALRTLAPAIDTVARDQARSKYAGVYVARASDTTSATGNNGNRTGNNSMNATVAEDTLRLEVDDGPGLRVAALDVRGVTQEARMRALTGGFALDMPQPAWRLYPAGLRSSASSGGTTAVQREGFRALLSDETPGKTNYTGRDLCSVVWLLPGLAIYGQKPIDEFIVHVDPASGRAVSVEAPAWKLVFERAG
jgi:hypothetical protein